MQLSRSILKKTPLWALVSILAMYSCAEMQEPDKTGRARGGSAGEAGTAGESGSADVGGSEVGGNSQTGSGGADEGSGGTTEGKGGKAGTGGSTGTGGGAVDGGKGGGTAKGGSSGTGGGGGASALDGGKAAGGSSTGSGGAIVDAGPVEGACEPTVTFKFPVDGSGMNFSLPQAAACVAVCGNVAGCGCSGQGRAITANGKTVTDCAALPTRLSDGCRYWAFAASTAKDYWGEIHCY